MLLLKKLLAILNSQAAPPPLDERYDKFFHAFCGYTQEYIDKNEARAAVAAQNPYSLPATAAVHKPRYSTPEKPDWTNHVFSDSTKKEALVTISTFCTLFLQNINKKSLRVGEALDEHFGAGYFDKNSKAVIKDLQAFVKKETAAIKEHSTTTSTTISDYALSANPTVAAIPPEYIKFDSIFQELKGMHIAILKDVAANPGMPNDAKKEYYGKLLINTPPTGTDEEKASANALNAFKLFHAFASNYFAGDKSKPIEKEFVYAMLGQELGDGFAARSQQICTELIGRYIDHKQAQIAKGAKTIS